MTRAIHFEAKATLEQYLEIGQMIKRRELCKGAVQALIEGRTGFTSVIAITIFDSVPVDYSILPGDDFREAFDWISQEYYEEAGLWQRHASCEDLPTQGERDVSFALVAFNRSMTEEDILSELEIQGLRPATFEELISFARKHPELQRRFWIQAFGSYCHLKDLRRYPALSATPTCEGFELSDSERNLSMDAVISLDVWSRVGRALAVYKAH